VGNSPGARQKMPLGKKVTLTSPESNSDPPSAGAIYKIQAGDRIWHLNTNEPVVQTYTPGPVLVPGVWFEYEIVVQGDDYTVFLTNLQTGVRQQTTLFHKPTASAGARPASSVCRRMRATPSPGATSESSRSARRTQRRFQGAATLLATGSALRRSRTDYCQQTKRILSLGSHSS